jgi:hypothetical protein
MSRARRWLVASLATAMLGSTVARAEPLGYPWRTSSTATGDDLAARIAPPAGATRVVVAAGSFGDWLRHLPLLPRDSPVLLYDGTRKSRQDVHEAVIDIDVGNRDLQQCPDAVMRLRAEYLFAAARFDEIRFHPSGRHYLLLGQSYMPAQQMHVLKNLGDSRLSPWYDAAALTGPGVTTPEWRPFKSSDWRRFAR